MNVLVTGGAGFIGSHTVKKLAETNSKIYVLDNLTRGHIESLPQNVQFIRANAGEYELLDIFLKKTPIDAVIHFAAFAYVGESTTDPDLYYKNNVEQTLSLLRVMKNNSIRNIVFSSTCSVYGNAETTPILESTSVNPINPYARTKYMLEEIIKDHSSAYGLNYVILRYFNAAGASMDGKIGESHTPETHLIPLVIYNALDKTDKLTVYGYDYPTPDGTCIRDYIHVDDLASAHIAAMEYLLKGGTSDIINLGTGEGTSILEIISLVEEISGSRIKFKLSERREGDPAALVASNGKAMDILGWQPRYNIRDIIKSAYNWYLKPKY